MQFSRNRKKDKDRNSSGVEDGNISVNSGLGDTNQKTKDRKQQNQSREDLDKSGNEVNPSDFRKSQTSPLSKSKDTPSMRQSVLQSVRNNLNDKKPITTLSVNLPKEESNEIRKSPIRLAGVERDSKNMSISMKRSPRNSNVPEEFNSEDSNNLNPGNDISPTTYTQKPPSQRNPREHDREINLNSRDINLKPNLTNKMSPTSAIGEVYDDGKNQKIEQRKYLKKISDLNPKTLQQYLTTEENFHPHVENLHKQYTNDIESLIQMKNVNKLPYQKQMTRGFEPINKKEGRLINRNSTSIGPLNVEMFPDRRTVLQKMNRLSNIMLSKSRSMEPNKNDDETQFRNTLNDSNYKSNSSQRSPTSKSQKFIRISMAMLASKGPNCENRIITRGMRFEKGGVVDFAQRSQTNKKYEVKTVRRKGEKPSQNTMKKYSIKEKDKASKIMQAWWRDILGRYKSFNSKILLIQKVWRSHWLRTHFYDIVYSSILLQNFVNKFKTPLIDDARRFTMTILLPYAVKYQARKNLTNIIKIQRSVKSFLDMMRNKRKRMAMLLDKLVLVRKLNAFTQIKKVADENDLRKMRQETRSRNLVEKVKKAMRTRIFHDILFKIFKKPVSELKNYVFTNMLRSNINKSGKLFLRSWFMKWLKNTLKSGYNPKRGAQLILKSLMKIQFYQIVRTLKRIPAKGLKEKIMRRFVTQAERFKDIFLKHWIDHWSNTVKKMATEDFKNTLLGKFLFRTAKNKEKINLLRKFRIWRNNNMKKKDLKPFIDGIEHLEKHTRKVVYKKVMPIDIVDGAKSRVLKSLMRNSNKFSKIPLRHYFNKLKNINTNMRRIEMSGLILKHTGNRFFKKTILNILLKRFLNWKRQVNIHKYSETIRNYDTDKRKVYAALQLGNATTKLAKRAAFKVTYPQIIKMLNDLIRQKATKKLLMMNPKLNRIVKKNYWNKWTDQNDKLRQKELRNKFFNSLMNKSDSKMKQKLIRNSLQKWKKSVPKNTELKYFLGSEVLLKALWRRNINKPVEAFKNKIELDNVKNGIQKAFNIKDKFIKRHWREYLIKWSKISEKLKLIQMSREFSSKIAIGFMSKFVNKILTKRFSHWKKVPKVTLAEIYERFRNMLNFTKLVVDRKLKPMKKEFLKELPKRKGDLAYKKAIRILGNLALNGKLIKLKSAVDRWKHQNKQSEIHDLKLRLLKYAIGQESIKNSRKKVGHYFNRWLRITHLNILQGYHQNDMKLLNGINLIEKIKKRKMNDLFTRMSRLMNLDPRGKMLLNMRKRLNMPRTTTSRCFDRWRRINTNLNKNQISENFRNSLMTKSCKKLADRFGRDRKMKCFNKWKAHLRKPEDYMERIIKGESKVFKFFAKKFLHPQFIPDLKMYSKKKFLRQSLLKTSKFHIRALDPFFKRWKKTANNIKNRENKANLVGKLIGKTTKFYNNTRVKEIMKMKFNQWFNNIRNYDIKINSIVPKAHNLLRINTMKKSFSLLIKPMKNIRLKSRRKEKFDECEQIAQKWLFNRLRMAVNHWRSQIQKDQMKDLRNKTMQSHLKAFTKRIYSDKLKRLFLMWKGKTAARVNKQAVVVGSNVLTRLLSRKPYHTLKNKTKMMNLKVPYGMSLSKALYRLNPNVAKCIAVRNIALRNHFRKWKSQSDAEKTNELKIDIFKKLYYPNLRNMGRLIQRKALNKWRDIIEQENNIKTQKKFHSTILKNMYNKNHNLWLRHSFKKWKDVNELHFKRLDNISLGLTKLKHKWAKFGFLAFYKKVYVKLDGFSRFAMMKKILINTLRNNDKGDVLYCFSKWKKVLSNLREQTLKHKILKNILNKYDTLADKNDGNSLHEKLLRWRIRSIPKDYYDMMNRYRLGAHALIREFKNENIQTVMDNIKSRARLHRIKENMHRLVLDYDKKADLFLVGLRFKHWRIRVGDTEIMVRKFRQMSNEFIEDSDLAHNELIRKDVDALTTCMNSWVEFKSQKAVTIQDYCKNLLMVFKRIKLVNEHKKLHKLMTELLYKTNIRLKSGFALWQKQTNMIKAHGNAKIIQNFLRDKIDAYNEKKRDLKEGFDSVEKFVKLKVFNDLFFNGRQMRKKQILLRLMKDIPEEIKLEFQERYFLRWWSVILRDREHKASQFITNIMRGFIARKLKGLLINRRNKINNLMIKLFGKYLDKKTLYFNKWLLDYRNYQIQHAGQVIQDFLKSGLINSRRTKALKDLNDLFRKAFVRRFAECINKAKKINPDRAAIMNETLVNIFIRQPFEKLKEGSKWIGRLVKLHHAYPVITQALRKHWLPYYMRRWKERTYDDKIRKLIKVQNWFRARLILWKARAEMKKLNICQKYISKLTNDKDLILKLHLKNWMKKAKLQNLHGRASAVQSIWRGNTSRKNVDRVLSMRKMNNFFRRSFIQRLNDMMIQSSDFIEPLKRNLVKMNSNIERRYTLNNLIDLANNTIRNSLLFALTKKREFIGQKTLLREYFDRFKRYAGLAEDATLKMQTRYRQHKAKNELRRLLKIKDKVLKLYCRYDDTEKGKLKIANNKWNNKASFLKLNDNALIIQNFTKVRYARWKNTQFKNKLYDMTEKLVNRRLNNFAKFNNLNKILLNQNLNVFMTRLRNKEMKDKYLNLFTKRFYTIDEQLKILYMKKYLNDWNNEAKKINQKRLRCALALTSMFRGKVARAFVGKLLLKKQKLNFMLSKLVKDCETKKQILLRLWYYKTRAMKMLHSAKVLETFLGDIKEKNNKVKNYKVLMKNKKGLDKVKAAMRKAAMRSTFNMMKQDNKGNQLEKVTDQLQNAFRKIKKGAFSSIKKHGDDLFDNRTIAVDLIRQSFINFKHRKGIWALVEKIRKMKFLLKLMGNRKLRILNKAVKIWKRNALKDLFKSSAETIQNFLETRVLRWRKDQKINSMENLYKLFRNSLVNNKLRPYLQDFNNSVKFERMFFNIKLHIFKKFRANIFNYEKSNMLTKLFKLTPKLGKKLVKKNFDRWRGKTQKIREEEAASRLQRKFRNFKQNKKNKNISKKMERILLRLACQNEDIRKYCFSIWKRNHRIMKTQESAKVISDFLRKHYDSLKGVRKWWNLTNQMFIRHNILSGLDFSKRYKNFRVLTTIFNVLDNKIKRDGFDDLKNKGKFKRSSHLIRLIFSNFENRQNIANLWHHFKLWNKKVGKYHERERRIKRLADVVNKRQGVIAAKTVNDACLMKKLFFYIDIIRAKQAMAAIKWRADNKNKLRRFADSLKKADTDLDNKNVVLFHDKVYRLYMFKILDNVCKRLHDHQKKVIGPFIIKKFINRLSDIMMKKSQDTYEDEKSFKRHCNPKLFNFKADVRNPKRQLLESMQSNPAKYLGPHLGNFLDDFMKKRLRHSINKIKENQKANKFMIYMNGYFNKALIKPKTDLYDRMNKKYIYDSKTPMLKANLFALLRKSFIIYTCDSLYPVGKMHRLIYLVRVTMMHKEIANKRFTRELVRRWRFLNHMRKLAKQKMEAMYKNMHLNYLNMTREVFGDDETNPGMIKEFERFGNSNGLFNNVDIDEYEEDRRRMFKTVSKKYSFEPMEYRLDADLNEESHYDENSLNRNSNLGDNPDFYYEEKIGDQTQGRYKVDTNRSGFS